MLGRSTRSGGLAVFASAQCAAHPARRSRHARAGSRWWSASCWWRRRDAAVLGRVELDARVRRDRVLFHVRDDVEPARRLRRHGVDRTAGVLRLRRLRDADARQLRRCQSLRRHSDRGAGRGGRRAAGVVARVPAAGRLLRDRHLGHRRGVPPELCEHERRSAAARAPASPRCAASSRATRESLTFWIALACVVAAIAWSTCSCAASSGWRCWRSATTRSPPRARASRCGA